MKGEAQIADECESSIPSDSIALVHHNRVEFEAVGHYAHFATNKRK